MTTTDNYSDWKGFIFSVSPLIILVAFGIIMLTILVKSNRPIHIKQEKSYIPVLINDHDVLLIRGSDTIKLSLENPCGFQEEYIVFVTQ